MDTSAIGIVAAHLMDSIAERYEDAPVVVGEAILIVEVKADPDADPSEFKGEYENFGATIEDASTDGRLWVQMGLLGAVAEGKKMHWAVEDRDDEE